MTSYVNELVNKRMYVTPEVLEYVEYAGLALIALLVPLLFRHPQLLVGSVVNFMLIMAAVNVRGWKKIVSLILLPSVAAVAGGYLFGPFTIFLIYMMPFIWVSNAILVFVFKSLYVSKRKNYLLTLPLAAGLKASFLFGIALLLFNLSVLPQMFLIAMGLVQLATALIGGLMAFSVSIVYRKYFSLTPLNLNSYNTS